MPGVQKTDKARGLVIMQNRIDYPDRIVPKTSVLEMTYQCNHQCLFCSVPWESSRGDYSKQKELSGSEWMRCIDELLKHRIQTIAFSGGEPLLNKDLESIIRYARSVRTRESVFDAGGKVTGTNEKELELTLISNGELITAQWVDVFKRYRLSIVVSLPGIDSFKELTGGGNYKNPLLAIQKMAQAGQNVVVSICVTKKNLPELFQTIALGFLHGAKALLLNRFLPGGRGIDNTELGLDQEELIRMLDIAEEVCSAANCRGSIGTELPKCLLTKSYKMITVGTRCSGGIDFFAIDPAGNVRPCNHSPVKLGRYTDILAAIRSDYWQRFKQRDFLPDSCSSCALSLHCDGGCREAAHITGGTLSSEDPVFQKKDTKVTCLREQQGQPVET